MIIGADAFYLIRQPDAGEGGARIIYLDFVIAALIYLLRCYAKNVKTDLTADEKKELRQLAAHLKGAQ